LICGDKQYSYSQLKQRVDKLACGFKSIGIHKNDKIAVIHKNCHRFLEAYFAAAKIGAILVPINYRLARKDFTYILNNSEAKALIVQPCFLPSILEIKDELPLLKNIILTEHVEDKKFGESCLDYESFLENVFLKEDKVPVYKDSDIAQIYYTSGTTGKPKGVILTHKNLLVHTDGFMFRLCFIWLMPGQFGL